MSEKLVLKEIRSSIDREYVGFTPNGSSIKPVHIAGGALRTLYGMYNKTLNIKKLALVADAKGKIPPGNDLHEVFEYLNKIEAIEEDVSEISLDSLRNILQRLISADKGVYIVKGLKDGMISYTAGSKFFLTSKALYEDTGEFFGGIIRSHCLELAGYIKQLLEEAKDAISLVFAPVLDKDTFEIFEGNQHEDIPSFKHPNKAMKWFLKGLQEGGSCLKKNLENHSNPLTQIRLFNFFCIFHLIRYITMLEAFYCDETPKPILLDFSGLKPSLSSVAWASQMNYIQMHKAINRFYAWGYAERLKDYSIEELLNSETPVYDEKKIPSASSKQELETLWSMAKEEASQYSDENKIRLTLGETIYDMLALEASSNPVNFVKALGTAAGILYPPDNKHPNKRFVLSQDMLEMLLCSCVNPNEVLSGKDMRERLWQRFGVLIGGSEFEISLLQSTGIILQVDEDALESNFVSFASTLESMDFAEVMADGILQIRLGGANND